MGNCIRSILRKLRRKPRTERNIYILLVGLDGAGKTLICNRITGDNEENVVPTMGFRTVSLRHKSCNVKIYDIGGSPQIRSIWPKYYNDVHGLIYVVDASNTSRISENRMILGELISHENVSGKPLLLLANKQDLSGALDELDLVENLNVERVANAMRCPTRVETCSCFWPAINSCRNTEGIISGYEWLLNIILKNYQSLDSRLKVEVTRGNAYCVKSASSSPTPSKTESITSNPFKPIHELLNKDTKGTSAPGTKNGTSRKISPMRRFLVSCTNKTAPMSAGDVSSDSQEKNQVAHCDPSIFQVAENPRPRPSTVKLEPLNLRATTSSPILSCRPLTAPRNVSKNQNDTIISIIPERSSEPKISDLD